MILLIFLNFQKKNLNNIETKVNLKIKDNISIQVHNNIPLNVAKNMGAIMLFGEKYGDTVRVIQYESSIELCGGTHVSSTQKFYLLKFR